ncbi:MAG: helix-turn-helix domain-containing protein [Proteobacteria bacterium]|nr:helix-turn-helix domain-containing protein [Pseudomonadota bacterium]
MIENKYYTIPQAAEICAVGRSSMWRWVKSGKIPAAITVGRHHRIFREDLFTFIEQKEMTPRLKKSIIYLSKP